MNNKFDIFSRVDEIERKLGSQHALNKLHSCESADNMKTFARIFRRLVNIEDKVFGENYDPYSEESTIKKTISLDEYTKLAKEYNFGFDFQRYLDLVKHFGSIPEDELAALKAIEVVHLDGSLKVIDALRLLSDDSELIKKLDRLKALMINRQKKAADGVSEMTFAEHKESK